MASTPPGSPVAAVAFKQPPQAVAAGPRDGSGHRSYDTWGQPVSTAVVRAEPGQQARATAVAALTAGLAGLPHARLDEVAVAIPLTMTADPPAAARPDAYRAVRVASATCPQCGLPITISATHREPDIGMDGEDRYRATWHDRNLVCLRGARSVRLAEQAARPQLDVLADELPQLATVPLSTVYVGEHIDHRLDPDRD